ncbi:MAG: hypothetical protein AAB019_02085 [Planctomycetota bacterium]
MIDHIAVISPRMAIDALNSMKVEPESDEEVMNLKKKLGNLVK